MGIIMAMEQVVANRCTRRRGLAPSDHRRRSNGQVEGTHRGGGLSR